jgi:hypothetical protein
LPEETEEQTQHKGKAGRTPKISAYDETDIVGKHAQWPQGARGFYTEMTAKYGVSRDTIERILRRAKQGAQNLKAA